ncbi:hypothetical protein H5410_042842 [Solanum commersonii]|uniref:Uncharacterized protein n=1 Tax=Solanum commersonii TaxID=4109 RepID=A0A9J5XYL9_SOLCO|nr:hypothetical protein H5410_042842 [Solanum commersonii]
MFKKLLETPRKSPRFDGTSIDDVHVSSFYILSETPPPKTIEIPATGGSSRSKNKKDKNNEAKESVIPANQKGKKRKGKTLIETPSDSDSDLDFVTVEINAKYHRERYATILWHYEKTKNEDGAITTGTVASKFGGPRIVKEHVPEPPIILHQDHQQEI